MKRLWVSLFVMVATVAMVAQTPGGQSAAPPAGMKNHAAMHQEHMQAMQSQLDTMRARINALQSALAKVKDPAAKQALQADLELWQAMNTHMQDMQKMMASMPGPPAGMGGGGMMSMDGHGRMAGCCAKMHDHEGGGCCAAMKDGAAACCGGNRCMRGPANAPANPDNSDQDPIK